MCAVLDHVYNRITAPMLQLHANSHGLYINNAIVSCKVTLNSRGTNAASCSVCHLHCVANK